MTWSVRIFDAPFGKELNRLTYGSDAAASAQYEHMCKVARDDGVSLTVELWDDSATVYTLLFSLVMPEVKT